MPSLRKILSFDRPSAAGLLAVLALATLAPISSARAGDPGWPRQIDSPSGSFVIYQPQPEQLDGDVLTGRAAFSLHKSGDANSTFGVLWFTERLEIDRDSSTVTMRNLDVTKVRLPGITVDEASRYEKIVETEAARWDLSGTLDELQAGLAATERERASVADLGTRPPRILFAYERAILVVYDGAPVLEPIEGSTLQRVANTPYAVVYDPASRDYYLNGANLWYTARNPLGPWTDVPEVPAAVLAVVPPDTSSDDQVQGPPPTVLTATEPTELISTDGPPRYAPLVGDELLIVTNTESDVVREVSSQDLYVLLAGRWFRGPSPDGPWTFVRGDQLPASFQKIPADSPRGNLLASVAGTDQAEDAVADAEIPQTSAIQRGASDFEVVYDGYPEFEPIEGTSLQYAVNTDAEVILADGRYYACDQGIWYIADSPEGPWSVSETRPLEVDEIPPTCPVYNVRYVYVFDSTPDAIYMGYLPGYVGCYPYYGTVVYGTGHRYVPWRGRHHYFPRPATWGFHARYNPWLSRWSFGFSWGTGFLRVGTHWRSWQPSNRRLGPPLWFGPGGYRRPLLAADHTLLRTRRPGPRPGVRDRAPTNLYNRPENVGRVNREALRVPVRRVTPRPARLPNNVFAGRDGKVYQRDDRGNWKVSDGRNWKPTKPPVEPLGIPPVTGAGTQRGGVRGVNRPVERPLPPGPAHQPTPGPRPAVAPQPAQPPRPEPSPWPPHRQAQPQPIRSAPPTPPTISPVPGNLEREYHARERAGEGVYRAPAPAPAAPAPSAPAREGRPREKPGTGPRR